jgi:hypothetical protein
MMHRSESGPLALPLRIDRSPYGGTAVRMEEHRTLGRSSTCQVLSAADVAASPGNAADAAQAGLFEGMLQAEMAQLREMAIVMIPRRMEKSRYDHRPPKSLTELTARMEEVHRLLTALRGRFPNRPAFAEAPQAGVKSGRIPVSYPAR